MSGRQTRPRIFLSSTVQDFEDLRSALKFWLEELGFDVQASNYPDFEHAPDSDTIEACLQNVRDSDYYLLLIGTRRGWYIEDRGASVTQLEYREAISGLRSRGKPHVVLLVRQSLLTQIDVATATGAIQDEELAFVNSFLDEIRGVGDSSPMANWTIPFRTFRDVVDGIKSTISVARSPLARQAVLENLRQELEYNLLPLMTKVDGQPFFGSWWLESVREQIQLTDIGPDSAYDLTSAQVQDVVVYITVGVPRPDSFVESALADALLSGALLDYDRAQGNYRPSRLLEHLYDTRDQLALFARRQLDGALRRRWYEFHESSRRWPNQPVRVTGVDLLSVFGLHDTQKNIERLILSILFFIYSGEHEEVVLRHSTPVENQREQIDRERVTQSELRAWLSQNHVILRSALRDVTADEHGRMRRVRVAIAGVLGEERTRDFLAARQPTISPEEILALKQILEEEGFLTPPATPDR